ncbi:MAG: protein kinase [Kofleriaceae bacterium]
MNVGGQIGQYRILKKLGEGGMGVVALGEHILLGRRAAIKTLHSIGSVVPELVERFFNEARATSAISDPGVIQVFDFGYHVDGTAYIVMELLEGESLEDRIERLGKLPLGDALRIARQAAGSLATAHACGVVHRDLKPDNLFLVRDHEALGGERTKILDFGICSLVDRRSSRLTEVGIMMGTPGYMSPEQCRGDRAIDHRSDIYSLGCVMFQMITGRQLFTADAPGDLVVAHLQEDPPAPSLYVAELPFEVDSIVLRCLAKSPIDRFQSMAELHTAIADLQAAFDLQPSEVLDGPLMTPLAPGFRSDFNANHLAAPPPPPTKASVSAVSAPVQRATPQLRSSTRADRGSSAFATPSPGPDDIVEVIVPERLSAKTALALALVTGGVLGLIVASVIVLQGAVVDASPLHRATSARTAPTAASGSPAVKRVSPIAPAPDHQPADSPSLTVRAPSTAPAAAPVVFRDVTACKGSGSKSECAEARPEKPRASVRRGSSTRARASAPRRVTTEDLYETR